MATDGPPTIKEEPDSSDRGCPICFEVYRDPRALACLHTFCLECLELKVSHDKMHGKLGEGIECPLCRTLTKPEKKELPSEDWVKRLPPNYALVSVLQTFNAESVERSKPKCQPCAGNGIVCGTTVFCLTCKEYQCKTCISIHSKFNFMKDHKWIDMDEKLDKTIDFTYLMQCNEHGKDIEYYCTSHMKLCCTTCAIIAHSQCKKVELRKADIDIHNIDVKRDLANMVRQMERVCIELKQNESFLDSDILTIENRLQSIRTNVMKRLDKFETDVRDTMKSKRREVLSDHETKRAETNRLMAALDGSICTVDKVMEKGSQEAKVVMTEKLKQQCVVYRSSISQLVSTIKGARMNLVVSDNLKTVCETVDHVGYVETDTSEMKLYPKTENYELIKCLDIKKKDDKAEPLIVGIGFIPNERIVIVDNKNDECFTLKEGLQHLRSCKLQFTPQYLAVLSPDEILITGGKAIHYYTVSTENDLIKRNSTKLPTDCVSISEIDKDNFLIGCLDTNIPVSMVSRQGQITALPGDFPDMKYGRNHSRCAFSKASDHLIVSLCDRHEIRVVDIKHKTTTVIKDDNLIKSPRAVVATNDPHGSFYVCSEATHSIVQIAFDGVILGYHKLKDMKHPYCIAISKDNSKLLVSNATPGDKKILLFDLTNN